MTYITYIFIINTSLKQSSLSEKIVVATIKADICISFYVELMHIVE